MATHCVEHAVPLYDAEYLVSTKADSVMHVFGRAMSCYIHHANKGKCVGFGAGLRPPVGFQTWSSKHVHMFLPLTSSSSRHVLIKLQGLTTYLEAKRLPSLLQQRAS